MDQINRETNSEVLGIRLRSARANCLVGARARALKRARARARARANYLVTTKLLAMSRGS